jgi:hypothetical protein
MFKIFNKVILIVGMIVVFSSRSYATEKFEIGTGLMAFNYAEYNNNDVFLDGETGLIPGIILKIKNTNKSSYIEWVGSFYYNKIKYDGQTQSGTPLTTISDAAIVDTHFKIGKNFAPSYGREQSLYMGLGYRYWLRNIYSGYDVTGNPVAGLLEEYHWYYGHVGYTARFDASENVKVGLDFRLTKMFSAQMDIDFLGFKSYDNTSVNLGNKIGARLAMPIEIEMAQSIFFLTPYYEIIDIGKSNSVRVYSGGVATNTVIYEPRSETRNVGVELTWLW